MKENQEKTLIFIQASLGPDAAFRIPSGASYRLDDGRTATRFLFDRIAKAIGNGLPEGCELKVLTNDPEAVGFADQPDVIILHDDLKSGSSLCDYLEAHPEYTRVVRLLGHHPLTDPQLVTETLIAFDNLPQEHRSSKKLGPHVCEVGQNIEVMIRQTLLESRRAVVLDAAAVGEKYHNLNSFTPERVRSHFEEHVTPCMHSAAREPDIPSLRGWWTADTRDQRVKMGFAPLIAAFPGPMQEHFGANVNAIIKYGEDNNVVLTFSNIVKAWDTLGLKKGTWMLSVSTEGKTGEQIRGLIQSGEASMVRLAEVEGPGI